MYSDGDKTNIKGEYFLLKKENSNCLQPLQMHKSLLVNNIMDDDYLLCKW